MEKNSPEKLDIELVERIEPIQEGPVDPDFEKKTMHARFAPQFGRPNSYGPDSRRVDRRLLPLMSALYAVALIDRTNLSVSVFCMGVDLNLEVSNRYSTVACLYFVPYILFQLPSNILLRFFGVRLWLTICVFGLAMFYLSSIVIGGFSGIIAYGITFLKGKGGLDSWNWIFIVQGILTVVLAILNHLFIADFPQKNTFLTTKQTNLILLRVEEDRGDSVPDDITVAKVLHYLNSESDFNSALMFMASTMPAYAIGYFVTIILNSMGWDAISCFVFAWMADKAKKRAPFIAVQALMTVIGIAVTGYAQQNGPRYFGLFLANAGAEGCIPTILAYSSNNIVSHSKRAVSTAVVIAAVHHFLMSYRFREQDFPRYLNGVWATIGCQILMIALLILTSWNFARKNRLSREGKFDGPLEGQPGFFYTL
ncbi:major facilitator superfamily domain-containing protein [Mycena galopus ATCC 62051]|nr:major facilitator superfamily domain-containing protein [Mycena galopus ATCC 62051]